MAAGNDSFTRTLHVGGRGGVMTFRKYTLAVEGAKDAPSIVETRHATIGTAKGNALTLADKAVSRSHAEIVVDENGYLLRDLDSKNGTFLDGIRVVGAYLHAGAIVGVGGTKIRFTPHATDDVSIRLLPADRFGKLVGPSLEMRALFALLEKVSPEDVTVLIEGESGTGKEIVASEIHAHSKRKDEPLVVFDCGAVPEQLIESELFGHVKGAFTGATGDRAGAFEQARGGTIFLDEIGELPKDLQPKLLRALEAREIRPVGSDRVVKCDVRVIAATNRDLAEEVARGRFREDLFFRLNVVRLRVPPLRHRREDVPALIEHLLSLATATGSRPKPPMPGDTMAMLATHAWPGNVRELKNFVDRYLVFAPADAAGAAELLDPARGTAGAKSPNAVMRFDLPFKDAKSALIDAFEIQYCRRAIANSKGNVTAAAKDSGIHRKYLEELVRKHGLK